MGLVLRSWAANEAAKHCAVVSVAWLFWRTFRLFSSGPQYYYLHQMLGLGLCISRASASVLNLNCSLVLLPMCRSILTVLRGTQQVNSRKARRLLDKSKTFHVVCGVSICVFSGELLNIYLQLITHLNRERWVCNYEIFWYTHNLFILFYIILMLHVVGGALKYQTNVDTHPPGCIRTNQTNSSSYTSSNQVPETQTKAELKEMPHITVCKEDAHFQHHFPQTWLWVTAPLCLYCAERLYRYIRGSAPVTVVSVIRHPCDVIELRMLKSGFKARPGQSYFINILCVCVCVCVYWFQCPTQNKETFGVHIRVLGDWTECLSELLFPALNHSEILPIMHQRTYPKYARVYVCVVGKWCVMRLCVTVGGWSQYRLRRLYVVWVCRELQCFYWFANLLCDLHHKMREITILFQSFSEERFRLLSSRLLIGRPRWKDIFGEIGRSNQHKKVGVFCCGPKSVSRELHKLCNSFSASGTVFEYNKESFS
uniref:NADPH oxidase 4 n=1 Tax=Astyanax mexicanus TaxID=7994 RepID=W5K8U1_ASTMX